MTFHEYLAKARQDDAQRAGERDRLLQTARRARTVRRDRTGLTAPAWRLARLMFRRVGVPPGTWPHLRHETTARSTEQTAKHPSHRCYSSTAPGRTG